MATEQYMVESLVQKRKHRSLCVCSPVYFNFICFIELVYLDNLTLETLVIIPKEKIIEEIELFMMGSNLALQKFECLCIDDEINA
jgi:hypothetical protein